MKLILLGKEIKTREDAHELMAVAPTAAVGEERCTGTEEEVAVARDIQQQRKRIQDALHRYLFLLSFF